VDEVQRSSVTHYILMRQFYLFKGYIIPLKNDALVENVYHTYTKAENQTRAA